jgi:exonuclease SbcD
MKILHTADLHIRKYEDERWKALESLIQIGKKEEIDIFVICGDLFDKGVSARKLSAKLRTLFSHNNFKIIIIRGNHDVECYKPDLYFGEDVIILEEKPYDIGNIRIVGLPFEEIEGENLLRKINSLKPKLTKDKKNILLFHGELLDRFYLGTDFGDEGNKRYMPVKLSYFERLNLDYVLAGHFHTNFDIHKLNNGFFVYSGSPISITKKETGTRKVNIFKVGSAPKSYSLATPYFESIDVKLDPFKDENPVQRVRDEVEKPPQNAKILLKVEGYYNKRKVGLREKELSEKILKITKERCEEPPVLEFKDIENILEDELFKKFISKIEKRDYDEAMRKEMQTTAILAMMEVPLENP